MYGTISELKIAVHTSRWILLLGNYFILCFPSVSIKITSAKTSLCQVTTILFSFQGSSFLYAKNQSTVNHICLETSRKSISFITYLLKRLPSSYFYLQKSIINSSLPRMFLNKWAQKSLLQVEIPNQKHIILFAEVAESITYTLTNLSPDMSLFC